MRFTLMSILALVATATAASVPGLPACAGSCVSSDFGGCGGLNVTCICSNGPLIANLACCVSKVCSQADQDATIKFADALCQGNGVTNLPTSATCAPGAQSTIAGSAASSSISLTGTAAAAVSSASSIAAANSSSSGTQSASTTVLTGSASGSATHAAGSSSTSAKATNAGNKLQAAAGVGALLFGAMAAL